MVIRNLFPEDKEFANQIAKYGGLRNRITYEHGTYKDKNSVHTN